jgi:ankyrin repeat protein
MLKRNWIFLIAILFIFTLSCKNNPQPKEITKPQISVKSFHDAAYDGNVEKVKLAIKTGIQANIVDENGKNALMLAAFNGHADIVKILIKEGVSVNSKDNTNLTALIYASSGPHPNTVQLLINNKANINDFDNVEHFTALMFAVSEGQLEVVKILMENGADASLMDIDGDNAEDFARQNKHPEVTQFLANYRNN